MKKALIIVGAVAGLFIVIAVAISVLVDADKFRPVIETQAKAALGREVKIGKLELSVFSGALKAESLSIADDPAFSNLPFVSARSLKVGVNLLPLVFSRKLEIRAIQLESPKISLLSNPAGKWNYETIGGPPSSQKQESASAPNISIGKLKISDGEITLGRIPASGQPVKYQKVDLVVSDISQTSKMPFTLSAKSGSGGSLDMKGSMGPVPNGNFTKAPLEVELKTDNLELAGLAPGAGISGLLDLEATLRSKGDTAISEGKGKISKLKAASNGSPARSAIALSYKADYSVPAQQGKLSADIGVGKANAKVSGGFDMRGASPAVDMNLNAPGLPVDEIEALLPAFGITMPSGAALKGGTLTANLAIRGPIDRPVISGPVSLNNAKLAGFDMGSKLASGPSLGGLSTGKDTMLERASATVNVAPGSIRADAINAVVPGLGSVTGAGTIVNSALNFKMTAALDGREQARLGSGAPKTIPFIVQGTTSNPSFVPDVGAMAAGKAKEALKGKIGITEAQAGSGGVTGLFGSKKRVR